MDRFEKNSSFFLFYLFKAQDKLFELPKCKLSEVTSGIKKDEKNRYMLLHKKKKTD